LRRKSQGVNGVDGAHCLLEGMSETLPPVTGNGVLLHFLFPIDASLSRRANVTWVRQQGGREVATVYASVEQGGEGSIVHTQVTFPGDCWAVEEADGQRRRLMLHVATGEREQRLVIRRQDPRAVTVGAPSKLTLEPDPPDEESELAAAIAESLETHQASLSTRRSSATSAASARQHAEPAAEASSRSALNVGAAPSEPHIELDNALQLSCRLARAARHHSAYASAVTSAEADAASLSLSQRARLQFILPNGERCVRLLPATLNRSVLVAAACHVLSEHYGLLWLAHAIKDGQKLTHSLQCASPSLRVTFHVGAEPLLSGEHAHSNDEASIDGLAPSATLRLNSISE